MQLVYFAQVESPVAIATRSHKRSARDLVGGPYLAGPIKIGVTSTLFERMLNLSSTTQQTAWFLGAFLGTKADERAMHDMFAHLRIGHFGKSGTEWFRPEWELTCFITSLPGSDLTSPYGSWKRDRASRARETRGAQLLTKAVEVPSQYLGPRQEERARVAALLAKRSGLWVTGSGVWWLMNGYTTPCGVLQGAIEAELGIPVAAWSERPHPAPHPAAVIRLRGMAEAASRAAARRADSG